MDINEIIKRINLIRTREKLSARDLSLTIGKSESYINSLENSHSFEPSLSTLLEIIRVCNSTPEEFFYGDIHQYQTDKKALQFFQTLSQTQKEAIMNLYKK